MSFVEKFKSRLRRNARPDRQTSPTPSTPSAPAPTLEQTPRILPDATWDIVVRTATPNSKQSTISAVWSEAWDKIAQNPETSTLAKRYETLLLESAADVQPGEVLPYGKHEQLRFLIKRQTDTIEKNEWKLGFQGYDFKVKSLIEPTIAITQSAKSYIGSAVEASGPASLAWAGVCLLLPLVLNPSEGEEARVKGLEYLSGILRHCSLREYVYRRRYETPSGEALQRDSEHAHRLYRESLRALYTKILVFEMTCFDFLAGNTSKRFARGVVKWDDWYTLLEAVKTQHAAITQIEDNWRDVRFQEEWEAKQREHQQQVCAFDAVALELSRMKTLIHQQQIQEDRSDLIRWLSSVVDPSTNYASGCDKHTQGTGEWILQTETFRGWMLGEISPLWIHGKAGSGKSILSTTIIKYLQSHCSTGFDQIYSTVAYFYFDFRDPSKQTRNNLLRSLIAQICQGRPDTPEPLARLLRSKDLNQNPPTEELLDVLRSSIQDFFHVYIILDALDECPQSENERDMLMGCIQKIQDWKLSRLHLLVTSRREHDIAYYLDKMSGQIDLEDCSEMRHDTETYIDSQLGGVKYRHWKPEMQHRVRRALIEKSQGMFQYVAVQLEVLCRTRLSEIEQALEEMPETIGKVYERALQQSPDPSITLRALKYLALYPGNMTLVELAFVAKLHPTFQNQASEDSINIESLYDEDVNIAAPEDILRWLPGLVTVQVRERASNNLVFFPLNSDWSPPTLDHTVRLCHFSLLEYLTSDRTDTTWRIDLSEARSHVVQSALAYCVYLIDNAPEADAIEYRAFRLEDSLRLLGSLPEENFTPRLRNLVRKLFDPASHYFGRLTDFLLEVAKMCHGWVRRALFRMKMSRYEQHMPLQLLCRIELWAAVPTIARLMPPVVNMIEKNGSETALSLAARHGQRDLVRFLLEAGADQFACNRPDSSALWECLMGRSMHLSSAKILLDAAGPDVVEKFVANSSDGFNPLGLAVNCGKEREVFLEVAEVLIERGADLTSALETAMQNHPGVDAVAWLIERGALVSSLAVQACEENVLQSYGTYEMETIMAPGYHKTGDLPSIEAYILGGDGDHKMFDVLQLLFSHGGQLLRDDQAQHLPDLPDEDQSMNILHTKMDEWYVVRRRTFRMVFESKSRDGTYVTSPTEAYEDFHRWIHVRHWVMVEKQWQWPPGAPSPSGEDMELFEAWWERRRAHSGVPET